MKKKLKSFLIFLLLVASLFLFIPRDNAECIWQKEIDEMEFYAIVRAKYVDAENHSIPNIVIKSIATARLDTMQLFGDKSSAFYSIGVSDTITKRTDNSEIYKVSRGEQELIAIVDFGCEQK